MENVDSMLPSDLLWSVNQSRDKVVSSWLTAVPLDGQGLVLNKQEFRDSQRLRYNMPLSDLPSKCVCGEKYTVCHALSCKRGGFVAQRHDGVRNLLTSLIGKVCTNVEVEPQLQPLDNERVLDVEMGFFTPLIFGTNGGMGADCNCFLKRLADREKLSEKNEEPYHVTITCPSVCDNGVSSLI